jgi:mRNA interferase MazF
LVLTRSSAINRLTSVVVAQITRTIRDIPSEVHLGSAEGLAHPSAANCDNLATVSKAILDPQRVGALDPEKVRQLDLALRFALGISY